MSAAGSAKSSGHSVLHCSLYFTQTWLLPGHSAATQPSQACASAPKNGHPAQPHAGRAQTLPARLQPLTPAAKQSVSDVSSMRHCAPAAAGCFAFAFCGGSGSCARSACRPSLAAKSPKASLPCRWSLNMVSSGPSVVSRSCMPRQSQLSHAGLRHHCCSSLSRAAQVCCQGHSWTSASAGKAAWQPRADCAQIRRAPGSSCGP